MLFRFFTTILRSALVSIFYALCIKRSSNNRISYTGEIVWSAPAHKHHRMLLEIMALTGDIRPNFKPIGQSNARNLLKAEFGLRGVVV